MNNEMQIQLDVQLRTLDRLLSKIRYTELALIEMGFSKVSQACLDTKSDLEQIRAAVEDALNKIDRTVLSLTEFEEGVQEIEDIALKGQQ